MLLDSNVILYAAQPEHGELRRYIAASAPVVSAISVVEILGDDRPGEHERRCFEEFFAAATVLPLTPEVLKKATELRRLKQLTLADALVAATAVLHARKLLTRNTSQFQGLPGLMVVDPWEELQKAEPNDEAPANG